MQNTSLDTITIINGQVCRSEKVISVADRAFNYGDGLFETMRLIGGRIPLMQLHFRRLQRGIDVLGLSVDVQAVQQQCAQVLSEHCHSGNGAFKLMVCRSGGGVAGYVSSRQSVNLIIRYTPLANLLGWYQQPVSLSFASGRLSHNKALAGLKHISRLDYIVAAGNVVPEADAELVFLDIEQNIVETMRHNIFCVSGNEILTPTIENVGVAGVLREKVLGASWLKNPVKIAPLSVDTLFAADEIFLTNALRGVIPVKQLDRVQLAGGSVAKSIADMLAKELSG